MKNELEYAKILESTGLSRENTEKYLRVIGGAILDNTATKQDVDSLSGNIKQLEAKVAQDIKQLEVKIAQDIGRLDMKIDNVKIELKSEMRLLEHRVVNKDWMATLAIVGVATTILGLLIAVF